MIQYTCSQCQKIYTQPLCYLQVMTVMTYKEIKSKLSREEAQPRYHDAKEELQKIEEAKKLVRECQEKYEARLAKRDQRVSDIVHS